MFQPQGPLSVRLSEHCKQYAGSEGAWRMTSLYQHAINCEEAKVETVVPKYWQTRMWEPILICNQPQSMNLACGLYLSSVWNLILNTHPPPSLHLLFISFHFPFFTNQPNTWYDLRFWQNMTQIVGQKRSGQPCHVWKPSPSGKSTQKSTTT